MVLQKVIHSVSAIREIHFWFRVQFILISPKSSAKFLLKILLFWKPSGFISLNFLPTRDSFHISVCEQSPVSVKGKSLYDNCPGLPQFPGKPVKVMKNQWKKSFICQKISAFFSYLAQGSGFLSLKFSKFFRVLSYSGYSYSGYWVYLLQVTPRVTTFAI